MPEQQQQEPVIAPPPADAAALEAPRKARAGGRPRALGDAELLEAVRARVTEDPAIGPKALNEKMTGNFYDVRGALQAVRLERGLPPLLDRDGAPVPVPPALAALVRMPEPPAPLDLKRALPPTIIEGIRAALDGAESRYDEALRAIQKRAVEEIEAAAAEQQKQVAAAQAQVAHAESFVDGLNRRIAEIEAEGARAAAEAVQERSKVEGMLTEVRSALQAEKAASALARSEAEKELERQKAKTLEAKREAEEWRSRIGRAERERDDAKSAAKRAEERQELAERSLKAEEERHGRTKTELEKANATAAQREGEIGRLTHTVEAKDRKLEDLSTEVGKLRREATELRAERDDLSLKLLRAEELLKLAQAEVGRLKEGAGRSTK